MGKIAELTDSGIPVHFFAGNHDLWVSDYLQSELGVIFHPADYTVNINGYKFYMAHGDAVYTNGKGHILLRWIFTNKTLRKLFAAIHPGIALSFAHAWSKSNRKKHNLTEFKFSNDLYDKICKIAKAQNFDYFVMGHLHLPLHLVEDYFRFIVLPDWFTYGGYAVFDGQKMYLHVFDPENQKQGKIIETE
jgi:UDP-2,3-diacylglucosamine hydrolase